MILQKQLLLFVFISLAGFEVSAQKIQSTKEFFLDTNIINVTVSTDVRNLQKHKAQPEFQPASFTWHNADSSDDVTEMVKIKQRGNMRKQQCYLASVMIDFSIKGNTSRFQNLGEIKWVAPCNFNKESEQWILKEFLVYKLYNILTDMSFRVRLIRLKLVDEKGKAKPAEHYAFAIEPIDALAKRLKSTEVEEIVVNTERTNRAQTTLLMLFQYMIGNTDWAVPNYHNVKLIRPADSLGVEPYVIPYDFDYAGIVNTPYAVPYEGLPITTVLERHYLGFPRTYEELKLVVEYMQEKHTILRQTIADFPLLVKNQKNQMVQYLDDFFELVKTEKFIRYNFIDNARKR